MTINLVPDGIGTATNAYELFFGSSGTVVSRIDIYNQDGTLYFYDAPFISGTVTIDYGRAERRALEVELLSEGDEFRSDPTGFWYDKIVRVYRGVKDSSGSTQMYQLGEFYIDRIAEKNFPTTVISVSCRDATKLLMSAKFAAATAFASGQILENIVRAVVVNGLTSTTFKNVDPDAYLSLPTTNTAISTQVLWEAGESRWDAVKALAGAYGFEVFMSSTGVFTMRPFVDPTTAPVQFTFQTGSEEGNLVSFERSTNDSRIFNHVIVNGGNNSTLPINGEAENVEPSSATSISRLGRRTYVYESKLVTTTAQANELAATLLRIMALESYELELNALVAPWLDVGVAIEFLDPNPIAGAPSRFLLTSLTIPLSPGQAMQASAKRVTIVS